jgi:hypothetical protein
MPRQTDRRLEHELRTLRPRAPERIVAEIVGRARAERRVRIGSPRLVTAALLTAAMLVAMGSVGGIGYAASATRSVAASVASIVVPAPGESRKAAGPAPAARPQSGTKPPQQAPQAVPASPARPAASPQGSSSRGPSAPGDTGGGSARTGQQSATSRQGGGRIDVCHATGSATNPYVSITVSVNGLSGHGGHPGDLIPAPSDGCPDDSPAEDQYRPGKGCGDRNHVHFEEGQCKKDIDDDEIDS